MWLSLLASKLVYAKVITINNNGSDDYDCCMEGLCVCNSLSSALDTIKSNTMVNITSEVISLNKIAVMGSGNLHNITITGNGATIMCSNSGGVYCKSCSDVIIEGITWDQCGDPSQPNGPGLAFDDIADLLIANCIIQWSRVCRAVSIDEPIGNVFIIDSIVHHNSMENMSQCNDYSSIHIYN